MIPWVIAQATTAVPSPPAQPAIPPVNWSEFSLLDWHGWGLQIRLGIFWLVLIIAIIVVLCWVVPLVQRKYMKRFRTRSVTLTFKGVEWVICPDTETRRVAHQAWVEIKSRKVGLPFEEGLDVIVEVYNSWYQLFGVLRDLAKSIPTDRLEDCEDTRNVVALLMKALNEGLRPHLTRWQAKFGRWYEMELANEANKGVAPQDIQKRYPEYADLVANLGGVHAEFVSLADSLKKIADAKG
ncbi:MAG: hypothetical protein ABFE13_03075 [Phycisphaerales bacterium]